MEALRVSEMIVPSAVEATSVELPLQMKVMPFIFLRIFPSCIVRSASDTGNIVGISADRRPKSATVIAFGKLEVDGVEEPVVCEKQAEVRKKANTIVDRNFINLLPEEGMYERKVLRICLSVKTM